MSKEIEHNLDDLQSIIAGVRERNKRSAMWDGVNPEIPLDDVAFDEFLKTFGNHRNGKKIEVWIKEGAGCESQDEIDGSSIDCSNPAVGSVDWETPMMKESVLSCRVHIRGEYRGIMINGVLEQGLFPDVTINGKPLPYPENN